MPLKPSSIVLAAILSFVLSPPVQADEAFKFYKEGRDHRAREDNRGSLPYLSKAVKLQPNNIYYLLERATARVETGDYKGAEADCNAILKLNPNFIEAYNCRGYVYLLSRRYVEGIADLDKVLKANKINITTWDPAMAYVNRAKAIQLIHMGDRMADTKMLPVYNDVIEALLVREQLNLKGAIAKMDNVVKADPNMVFPHLLRGVMHLNNGDNEKALKDLSFAVSKDPKCTSPYYFRADAYSRLNQLPLAIADYSKIIALRPLVVASSYTAETGRCKGSRKNYDENPVSLADVYVLRSSVYQMMKKDNEALKDLDSALTLEPQDADALIHRALLHVNKKNFDKAIADANKCVALNPSNSDYLEARSNVYEKTGHPDKAIEDLSKIISDNPDESGAYTLRGQLYDRLKQYDKSVSDYSRSLKIAANDELPLTLRSEAFMNLGKLDKALADCEKAISLDPKNSGPLYKLKARIHEKMGKPDLAKKDLELAAKWVKTSGTKRQ